MHVQAIMDWQRDARTGLAEAVYAAGKSTACLAEIVTRAAIDGHRLLLTRLSPETYTELSQAITEALDYDPQSRTAILGALAVDAPRSVGTEIFADVGVAGLWRLMQRLEEIREFPVVVAVAGMEGAMFSVLTGLVSAPIVAVPTSVGYGVSGNGQLALNSALGSCAPGLVAVNVDNGFGAAQAALRILNLVRARGP
jgi:NCAIR mutase (PurE)-related protein